LKGFARVDLIHIILGSRIWAGGYTVDFKRKTGFTALSVIWCVTAAPAIVLGYGFAGGLKEFLYSLAIGIVTFNPVTWWLLMPIIFLAVSRYRLRKNNRSK
jgi:hypothetical protein